MPQPGGRTKFIVVSGPSGVGKTTLCRRLLERFPGQIRWSVSATTRPMRPGETEGVDYFFLTPGQFDRKARKGEFLEWATVFGKRYGTLAANVDAAFADGKSVLAELDVQGGRAVKSRYGSDAVLIFIDPPGRGELVNRLRGRGSEGKSEISNRVSRAPGEIAEGENYDYRIVNDDLEKCYRRLFEILQQEGVIK